MAEVSSLTIEELTGDQRVVVLTGSGLPKKGAAWGGKNKVTTKFPAGSQTAVEHILGPEEAPSEWEGIWRTTQLARTPAVVRQDGADSRLSRAHDLRDVVEDIFRSGQRLRVTWAQVVYSAGKAVGETKIVRRGYPLTWTFTHDRADDVAWSATFNWGDRGQDQRKAVAAKTEGLDSLVQAALKELRLLVGDIETNVAAAVASVLGAADTWSLGDLESLAEIPQQFFSEVIGAANQAVTDVLAVADILNGTVATAATQPATVADLAVTFGVSTFYRVSNELTTIADTYTRQVPDAYSNVADRPAQVAKLYTYFADSVDQTYKAAAVANDAAIALRAKLSATIPGLTAGQSPLAPDLLAVYVARQGDTFGLVSKRFYGTVDYGPNLAVANGYASYAIAPDVGRVLVVPTLQSVKQSQQKF